MKWVKDIASLAVVILVVFVIPIKLVEVVFGLQGSKWVLVKPGDKIIRKSGEVQTPCD